MVALAASKFSGRQLAAQIAAGAACLAIGLSSLAPRSTEPDAAPAPRSTEPDAAPSALDRADASLTPLSRAPTQTPPRPR